MDLQPLLNCFTDKIALIFQGVIRLKLPQILLWIKLVPLVRTSEFFVLSVSLPGQNLWSWGWERFLLFLEWQPRFMNRAWYWVATSNLLRLPLPPWNLYSACWPGHRCSGSQYCRPATPAVESRYVSWVGSGWKKEAPNLLATLPWNLASATQSSSWGKKCWQTPRKIPAPGVERGELEAPSFWSHLPGVKLPSLWAGKVQGGNQLRFQGHRLLLLWLRFSRFSWIKVI